MEACLQRVADDRHFIGFGQALGVGGGFNSGWTYIFDLAALDELLPLLKRDGCCVVLGEIPDDDLNKVPCERVVELPRWAMEVLVQTKPLVLSGDAHLRFVQLLQAYVDRVHRGVQPIEPEGDGGIS